MTAEQFLIQTIQFRQSIVSKGGNYQRANQTLEATMSAQTYDDILNSAKPQHFLDWQEDGVYLFGVRLIRDRTRLPGDEIKLEAIR